jgi:hypothetical protein
VADVVPGPAPVLLLTGWALASAAARQACGHASDSEPLTAHEYSPAQNL